MEQDARKMYIVWLGKSNTHFYEMISAKSKAEVIDIISQDKRYLGYNIESINKWNPNVARNDSGTLRKAEPYENKDMTKMSYDEYQRWLVMMNID